MVRVEAERLGIDLATVHGSGPRGLITREDVRQAALHPRRVRSSPYARRRASELGIDLRSVAGSGPGGAVRAIDLIQAPHPARPPADAPASASAEAEIPAPARVEARSAEERSARQLAMRQAIAALMARSKREIPHYYLSTTIDLSAATSWLRARNAGQPPSEQLTVTNLGERGVESVLGVIYPPQVALVGFGKVVERPWAVDGMLAVRPVVTATLAADHRASDGHRGGLYLEAIDRLLQDPEDL